MIEEKHFQKNDLFVTFLANGDVKSTKDFASSKELLQSNDGIAADTPLLVLSMGPVHLVRRQAKDMPEEHVVSSVSTDRLNAAKTTEEGKEEKLN